MKRKVYPEISLLRDILDYNHESGALTWKASDKRSDSWNKRYAGVAALQSIEPTGYLRGTIGGSQYKAHVICWGIYYGRYPSLEIDHINGNKSDNRIENLRSASRSENQINIGIRLNNTSGYKGASWKSRNGKWQSQIQLNGKTKYLGLYNTAEEAGAAYDNASRKYHGEFGRIY